MERIRVESGWEYIGRHQVRAKGWEGGKGPVLMTGMHRETAAEGMYVNVGRENVGKPLSKALGLIHNRAWSCSRLEECYDRTMLELRSDPKWRLAIVVRPVGTDTTPC